MCLVVDMSAEGIYLRGNQCNVTVELDSSDSAQAKLCSTS